MASECTWPSSQNIQQPIWIRHRLIHTIVVHANCIDGTAALMVVLRSMGVRQRQAVQILRETPNNEDYVHDTFDASPFRNRNVMFLDFTYTSATIMSTVRRVASNVMVIDHHHSALERLRSASYSPHEYFYCANHSAAVMAWLYMFPFTSVPALLMYVEDADLHSRSLPHHAAFQSWIDTLPHDPYVYDTFLDDGAFYSSVQTPSVAQCVADRSRTIEAIFETSKPRVVYQTIQHVDHSPTFCVAYMSEGVPPKLRHDVAMATCARLPWIDFACIVTKNYRSKQTHFCLRSQATQTNVEYIASRLYGGGGHIHAAGVKIPYFCSMLPGVVHVRLVHMTLQPAWTNTLKVVAEQQMAHYEIDDVDVLSQQGATLHEYLLRRRFYQDAAGCGGTGTVAEALSAAKQPVSIQTMVGAGRDIVRQRVVVVVSCAIGVTPSLVRDLEGGATHSSVLKSSIPSLTHKLYELPFHHASTIPFLRE